MREGVSGIEPLAQKVHPTSTELSPSEWFLNDKVALQDYDDRIIKYGAQLEQHLATNKGQPVHVNDWFYWFSFDVMGDLTLAKSFNMLIDERWHYAILMMRNFMYLLGPFSPIPWLARLGFGIPGAAQGWKKWVAWCTHRMAERVLV